MNIEYLQESNILDNAFATVLNSVLSDGGDGCGAIVTIYYEYMDVANKFEEYLCSRYPEKDFFKRENRERYVAFIDNQEYILVMNQKTMKELNIIGDDYYYVVIP